MTNEDMNKRVGRASDGLTAMLQANSMLNRAFKDGDASVEELIGWHMETMDKVRVDLSGDERDGFMADVLDMFCVAIEMLLLAAKQNRGMKGGISITKQEMDDAVAAARSQIGCTTKVLRELIEEDTTPVPDAALVYAEINEAFETAREHNPQDFPRNHMIVQSILSATALTVLARAGIALPGLLEAHGSLMQARSSAWQQGDVQTAAHHDDKAAQIREEIMALVVLPFHEHDDAEPAA